MQVCSYERLPPLPIPPISSPTITVPSERQHAVGKRAATQGNTCK